jgi:uncharacterized integral membrane protein
MLVETAPGQPAIVWIIAAVIVGALVVATAVGFAMHRRRPWWH